MEIDEIKNIYNSAEDVWPKNDPWHEHTKKTIERKIYRWIKPQEGDIILNAGSGGTSYDLEGTQIHLDIADKKISLYSNHIVASIDSIPVPNNTFDYIICVGSVINYLPILKSLHELTRVLKPGGLLVLEYERSGTAGLWFKGHHNSDCFYRTYKYNGEEHGIWLYSEKLVTKTLKTLKMKRNKNYSFHKLSSIFARLFPKRKCKYRMMKFDVLPMLLSGQYAHNCISLWKKSF